MDVMRVVDAYCASCQDIRPHAVMSDDPSSCFCNDCGGCQTLVRPVDPMDGDDAMDKIRRRDRPGPGEIWFSGRKSSADSDRPGRVDVWSHDNVLSGIGLLAEALGHQTDAELLRDGVRWIRAAVQDAERRRKDARRPVRPVTT